MNATTNVWQQRAANVDPTDPQAVEAFRAQLADFLQFAVWRAVHDRPGAQASQLRAAGWGPDEMTGRLSAVLSDSLLRERLPVVTRDTVVLGATLAG
jgi:hypothetical protein